MTLNLKVAWSLATLTWASCLSTTAAIAQTAASRPPIAPTSTVAPAGPAMAPTAAPATAPAAAPATAPATLPAAVPAPQAAPPTAQPPVAVVPPGYALVPINSGAQTNYDVDYPQQQSGMEMPYEDGDPVPEGYRLVTRPRRGLVIAGSIVGGIAYGFSILGATADDFNHKSGALLVPVVGPWLMMGLGGAKDEPCAYSYGYDCGSRAGLRTALVLDGMMQAAGATMLIVGLALPTSRLVRKSVTLSMVPLKLGNDGYGFGAVGQF